MPPTVYRVKHNADESVDVWVGDRQIHFPVGGKPTVSEGKAPSDAVDSDPEVSLQSSDSGIAVGCHGRVVLIRPDGSVVVVPDKPQHGSTTIHRWRLRMSRPRD